MMVKVDTNARSIMNSIVTEKRKTVFYRITQHPQIKNHQIQATMLGILTLKNWGRDGAVVRAIASHQCGPGSIPRLCVICGLSLLVLYSAPRGFLQVLRFTLSSKTNISLDLHYLLISVYSVPN